jgi:selenocysteine lyase/cysteine desulfurase
MITRQRRHDFHTKGYQAMGSFHSENVDDLMLQSDDVYQPPELPFDTTSSHHHNDDDDDDFLLDRNQWTFLNHGAFGAALSVGYHRAQEWRLHLERQPLRYHDRDLLPHMVYSARRLAKFCHSPYNSFTLIPNVTYGLNTILKGYSNEFQNNSGHVILCYTSYGSLKKMANEYCPHRVIEIPVSDYFDRWWTSHIDDDLHRNNNPHKIFECALIDTLESFKSKQNINCDNAILILDHTTSNTAINMPVESLSKIAKEKNMLVLVDGAHGILAQDLTLNETSMPGVDFYLGNGHKWLSCPRGVGFMYSKPELQDTILRLPAVISHGVGQGLQSRFLWDGCRDYAAALSVPAVLDYWEKEHDPSIVREKIRNKLRQAVIQLCERWHGATSMDEVKTCLLAPWEVHSPMMTLVRLPDSVQWFPSTSDDAKVVQDYLYDRRIEVPIKCIRGVLYVRLSCHVYNDIHEYEHLAKTMVEFQMS